MVGSILLPLAGSQESLYALEFAWSLAEVTGSKVNAQHVVDTRGAFELVGMERPGIVGSGLYVSAYQAVCQSLKGISEKLSESYLARAAGRGIAGELFIDEGEPVEEICRRQSEHDLIIMGHRQRATFSLPDCQTVRLSLAEILAQNSSIPTLIIQQPIEQISEMMMFVSMDHINSSWIRNCLAAASLIGAECGLTILASGEHEEEPLDFMRNLRQAVPELEAARIRLVTREGGRYHPAELCAHHLRGQTGKRAFLAVVPTTDRGENRITTFGEPPNNLLRRLTFDAVLVWPEESTKPLLPGKAPVLPTAP
jgi:nucleotide-binding universal stress UspA family protein